VDQGWVTFWAVLAGTVWVAGYVIACRIWPYANCRKCEGAGKFRSPSGKAWRNCRRCKGSGSRVRYGRRVWTKLAAVKKDAVG
jgi:DnaJ-class molecular chaperone